MMNIVFEYNGSRGVRLSLLVLLGAVIEHNFSEYSPYIIFLTLILLAFTIKIDW